MPLSLETGSAEFFSQARMLDEKFASVYCEPFADHRPGPHNVVMTMIL